MIHCNITFAYVYLEYFTVLDVSITVLSHHLKDFHGRTFTVFCTDSQGVTLRISTSLTTGSPEDL